MATLDLYSKLAGMAPDVSRMRAQAQALRQRAAQVPQGQMVGQYFAAPPMTSQIANLGERILGGVMDRKASRTDEEYRNQLAQALRSPEGLSSIAETNPYAQNLMLMQQMQGLDGVTDDPSIVQEYKFAQANGFPGTYMDYINAKRGESSPSGVQEYEYYNNLPPEQKQQYLTVKRASQLVNLGGTQAVLEPTNPTQLSAQFPVTPKPEQMPEFRADVVEAEQAARGEIPESEKTETFKAQVTGNLQEVARLYGALDEMGAAVNVEKGSLANIIAAIGASDIGQAIQRRLGTDVQSIRNQINQVRPTLINNIRQASNMGARGLDSEKELEFYLQAATDPSKDVQANIAALEVLDKAYGLGLGISSASSESVNQLKEEYKKTGINIEILLDKFAPQ